MSAELLSTILWIPFALVALITGLIYCIGGYRKGLWQALVSLVAVVLSTVLSILTSRFLAKWIVPSLLALLPDGTGMGLSVAMLAVQSAMTVALAMVLFGVLMLIVTPIVSLIFRKCMGQWLSTQNIGLKWLGMLAGAVTAVAFSLFWLSPVYGTLATAAPVVQSFMQIQGTQDEDTALVNAYMEQMSRHFLVQASGQGPVKNVYDGLSRAPLGEDSVSLVDMTQAVEEAMKLVSQLEHAEDPSQQEAVAGKLIKLVREEFVDQEWFYTVYKEMLSQVQAAAADSTAQDIAYIHGALELLDMPKEEFEQVCASALDFAQFALEKGVLTMTEDSDPMEIYRSGILQEMGRVLNSSARMAELKKLAFGLMLEESGLTFQEANQLMEKYQLGQLTDPDDQLLEAEAMILPGLSREIPPVMAVLRHPSLGMAAVQEMMQYVTFQEMLGLPEETSISSKTQRQILTNLEKAAKLSFEELAQMNIGLSAMRETMSNSVDISN